MEKSSKPIEMPLEEFLKSYEARKPQQTPSQGSSRFVEYEDGNGQKRLGTLAQAEQARKIQQAEMARRAQRRPQEASYVQPLVPQTQPRVPGTQPASSGPQTEGSDGSKGERHRFRYGRAIGIGSAVLLVVGIGSVGYTTDFNGMRNSIGNVFDADTAHTQGSNGIEMIPLETLGTSSLDPEQCERADLAVMTVTVSGYMPLVPLLPTLVTAENPESVTQKAPKYLKKNSDAVKKLSSVDRTKLEPFLTDGYNHATLNDEKLLLNVCLPDAKGEDAVVVGTDGSLTVDNSALQVRFRTLNSIRGIDTDPEYQVKGATDVELDPSKGETSTLPLPENNLFIAHIEGQDAYNAAVDELNTAMKDPLQQDMIVALMKTSVVEQLKRVPSSIDFPNDAPSFEKALNNALTKRLVGDNDALKDFENTYTVQMDVPNDANKLPITYTPLKRLDSSQSFVITDLKVEYGGLKLPEDESTTPGASDK